MLSQNQNKLELLQSLESNTGDSLFLHRVIRNGVLSGQISRSLADQIQDQVIQISHKLIKMRTTDFGARSLQQAVEQGIRFLSLGLDYAANQDIDKAPGLMSKNPLVKFFQIGNTLITQLKQRATKTIESCRICPPTLGEIPKTIIDLKPILCYNAYENDFLESLEEEQITIQKAEVALHGLQSSHRPISHLLDLNIANQQIDNFFHRLVYFRSLPKMQLFSSHRISDGELDEPKRITSTLITNLVLFGVVDFDNRALEKYQKIHSSLPSPEKRSIEVETGIKLSKWVDQLFSDLSSSTQGYIKQYWQYCLHCLLDS